MHRAPLRKVIVFSLSFYAIGCDPAPRAELQTPTSDMQRARQELTPDRGGDRPNPMRDHHPPYLERDLALDAATREGDQGLSADQRLPEALSLSSLELRCNQAQQSIGLLVSGETGESPLAELWVTLLSAGGAPLSLSTGAERVPLDPNAYGSTLSFPRERSFQLRAALAFQLAEELSDSVSGLRLEVIDEAGAEVSADLSCEPPALISVNESGCDALGAFGRCAEEQGCNREGVCRGGSAPTLDEARVAVNVDEGHFSLRLSGTDEELDLSQVRLIPLSATETPLLSRALLLTLYPRWEGSSFSVISGAPLPTRSLQSVEVAAFELQLIDELGFQSAPLRVAARAPQARDAGALCDPLEAFDLCPPDQGCVLSDGELYAPARCGAPQRRCPETWPQEEVALAGESPWRITLAATEPQRWSAPGSCAGGPHQAIYQLSAARAGRYQISLLEGAPAHQLLARDYCALPALRFERGCGSTLTLSLDEGQAITLIIAGPGTGAEVEIHRLEEGADSP